MRVLGINLPYADEAVRNDLTAMAEKAGFEARFYDDATLKTEGAADCEVFFGKMPSSQLKSCAALKWFQCSFAGVDDYCDEALYPSPEVMLTNSAGAYGITISEHMVCSLLMMMRNMPKYGDMQKVRGWNRAGEMRSIYGSTIAVLGMGDIGSNFARRVKALGAYEVRGIRRVAHKGMPEGFDKVFATEDLDEALKGADVLGICLPATSETQHILDERRMALLNAGAYVLNVGRGSAIDQVALKKMLDCGHLAGAGIDVTVPEPLPQDDPLWEAQNLLLTPHVSGNMSLSHTRRFITDMFKENFALYLKGEPLKYLVDRKAGY